MFSRREDLEVDSAALITTPTTRSRPRWSRRPT
ncbi:hypothetical protein [Sphingomonas taxi]